MARTSLGNATGYEGPSLANGMASDLGRAMARLKHRDVRTRRRAVRTLFEHDDPSTLEAFESLLDDEDPWFVSKALDAYRQWAPSVGEGAVRTLLDHPNLDVRRAGANLLVTLGTEGKSLALHALEDEDRVVQKKAARALLGTMDDEVANALLNHASPSVRVMALKHPHLPVSSLENGLVDEAEAVRMAALEAVLHRDAPLTMDTLRPFANAGNNVVGILIWASRHAPEQVGDLADRITATDTKRLTDHLRETVSVSNDPLLQNLIGANVLVPVARWVARQDASEDDLRWWLIRNEQLPLVERSKLLERLIGRAGEPEVERQVNLLLDTELEPLIQGACENLSTAASELSP